MTILSDLRLYWETARHLRPVQVHQRLYFHAVRPQPDLRPAAPLRAYEKQRWVAPARRRQSVLGPKTFRFLNETHSLGQSGWDDENISKLWRYNLHYFDDLNAEGAEQRSNLHADLINCWIAENPPAQGTGWEPYPTSLRIVNWIKWVRAGNRLPHDAIHSLAVQTRWLRRRLEHYLLGNHLFANAKALTFAGCFFSGKEADRCLALGMKLLQREIPEQILPDGGQFELSPMYHVLALEDMLDLVNMMRSTGQTYPILWHDKIAAMRKWLATMCHPDGEISFFNDAAIGIAPAPAELDRYAVRLGFDPLPSVGAPLRLLEDSGYIRVEHEGAVALLDVARVGPDYLPGHAHADTLSFELSVHNKRVIVNSGTSLYGNGPERQRQRGTAAHNTIEVDGENSSEVWSGFRVARRARPYGLSIDQDHHELTVACGHDGYRRLPGQPVHLRTWHIQHNTFSVRDTIEGDRIRRLPHTIFILK